jgi:hypothetical protein
LRLAPARRAAIRIFYAAERNPDEIKAPWAEADERVAAARCAAGV